METQVLKVGDRVDVKVIIKESWQSKRGLSNGYIHKIEQLRGGETQVITVWKDRDSKDIDYHAVLGGGCFYTSAYKITKHV